MPLDARRNLVILSLGAAAANAGPFLLGIAAMWLLSLAIDPASPAPVAVAQSLAYVAIATLVALPVHRSILSAGESRGFAALFSQGGRNLVVFLLTLALLSLPFDAVLILVPDAQWASLWGALLFVLVGIVWLVAFLTWGSMLADVSRGRYWRLEAARSRFARQRGLVIGGWLLSALVMALFAGGVTAGEIWLAGGAAGEPAQPAGSLFVQAALVVGAAMTCLSITVMAATFAKALVVDEIETRRPRRPPPDR